MNVDDFPCLAVVYHHLPIRFSKIKIDGILFALIK